MPPLAALNGVGVLHAQFSQLCPSKQVCRRASGGCRSEPSRSVCIGRSIQRRPVLLSATGSNFFGKQLESWGQTAATLLATAILLTAGSQAVAAEKGDVLVGSPRVVDGDTLVIGGEKIRLFGLDAPESKQSCTDDKGHPYACGDTASRALKEKIGSKALQCQIRAKDLYGRNVSSCNLQGTGDVGEWLVSNGHAVAYRQYSKAYVGAEDAAKQAHKGIWQGSFEIPADFRRNRKSAGATKDEPDTPSDSGLGAIFGNVASFFRGSASQGPQGGQGPGSRGCQVKGNVSSKGQRIYHVPGGRYYDSVKIEPEKGEAFFCSEQDAQQAGFRRSKE